MRNKDAGREYAEIWGETVQSNRHLRLTTGVLGVIGLVLAILVLRLGSIDPPKPIVIRVDEVGRAEALAYEAVQAQADPLDPTTKYFLNRFIHDFYSRQRVTVQQHWTRSLRFLTTDLANAAFEAESRDIARVAAGIVDRDVRVENVVLRLHAQPEEPHSATADFELVETAREQEVERQRWSLSLKFIFIPEIPPDLVVTNPMGIVITWLKADRALVTEGKS